MMDFTMTDEERLEFEHLRDADREENLLRRWEFFVRQDPERAQRGLGFVLNLVKNPTTVIAVPGDGRRQGLAYSLGYWYRHGFPELMLVGEDIPAMQGVLERVGSRLPENAPSALQDRTYLLAGLLAESLRDHGLQTESLVSADDSFLADYPYGYGASFYGHFLDDPRVPLVRAAISAAASPA